MESEKYGRWTVLSTEKVNGRLMAKCQCQCGNKKEVRFSSIKSGESTSCGCYAAEQTSERTKTHGMSGHYLFQTWYDAYRRCYSPSRKDYHHYGGRGIQFSKRWMPPAEFGFVNFLEDMEGSYSEELELDRIDNDGNYCKENCKWSTRSEQCLNKRLLPRKDFLVKYKDEQICLTKLAKENNLTPRVLWDRLFKLNWDYEKAISEPMRFKRYLCETINGLINLNDFCNNQNLDIIGYRNCKKSKGLEYAVKTILTPHGVTALYGESKSELTLIYKLGENNHD